MCPSVIKRFSGPNVLVIECILLYNINEFNLIIVKRVLVYLFFHLLVRVYSITSIQAKQANHDSYLSQIFKFSCMKSACFY